MKASARESRRSGHPLAVASFRTWRNWAAAVRMNLAEAKEWYNTVTGMARPRIASKLF